MDIKQMLLGAALTAPLATAAWAQDYPRQPIRLVVPYAAGGMTDVVARIVGQRLGDSLGQPGVL